MTAPSFDRIAPVVDGLSITIEDVSNVVRAAGAESLKWFRRHGRATQTTVENKAADGFDPVTEADRHVESLIRSALLDLFPGHGILGEETGETTAAAGSSQYRWVIDPIDGTRAFVSGQPMWGTLLGLQIDVTPVAGWMYVPPLDEMYVAVADSGMVENSGGSWPLNTSDVTELADATLLCTHPTMFVTDDEQASFARVADACKLTRYSGDCMNYGLVATGDADLVVENQLQPYDVIPLIPLIEAAGGVITDRDGGPATNGGWAVAASTPELHAAALDALA